MTGRLLECHACGAWKPTDDFERRSTRRGFHGHCNTCRGIAPVPQWLRRAMCGKKARYRTQEDALHFALESAKRARLMRIYECPLCKGWHLTHKEAKAS